jgi:hypothetical protein
MNVKNELRQLESKDLKPYREKLALEQELVCPICKNKRELKDFVVDHQHKTKSEKNGMNGAGLVRGVICFMCNSTEGRMLSYFKRSGLNKDTDFSQYLRALADYLDQGTTNLIHPTEKEKVKPLMKRPFNKIKKLYEAKYPKRKSLEYPKSGKPTKLIEELAAEFEIEL